MGSSTRIGYIRVSSVDQNIERQLKGIELDKVFVDHASGRSTEARPGLVAMLEYVREGDEVIVHSMDRLARNLEDLLALVRRLNDKGVKVKFLKENMLFDPDEVASPISKLMLSVMGAVSEFERALILERQREGIAIAKARGAYKGRAKKVTSALLEKAQELFNKKMGATEVARELGVARSSLYRWFSDAGKPLRKQYGTQARNSSKEKDITSTEK